MTDYTSSTRDAALLAGLLANLPTDNGQLIPTPAEPGVINIDTVSDNQGLHTGTVDNFGFTDDLTPTLSGNAGTGGAGTVIQFCINTVLVGSAVVNSDGSWSFTPDQPLEANHEYIFQSVVQDGGSKQFLISLPYTIITTDSNADISVSATLDSVVDNVSDYNGAVGALKEGGLTNDARPELTGHATAGATVNIYDNGVLLATTTAKADGSWTYTPSSALTNGTHNLAVSATGATGESKPTAAFRIVVDTTAIKPVVDSATDDQGAITGNLAGGSLTDDSRPVLHGYAEPNTRVDVHVFGPNGKELYYDSVTSNADGTWDYQARAFTTQGTYSFGISSIDQAGNAWRDYGTKFTLKYVGSNQDDTTAPDAATNLVLNDNVGSIKGEIHSQGLTDDSTPTLTGKAEAGTTVVVSELGSATVAANGTWSFTPSPALADGLHSITTVVKDAAGQSSTVSDAITFTVDSHIDAPTITGYQDDVGVSTGAVENGGRTDDNNGVLSGHAEAGSIIRLTMWGPRGVKYGNVAHTVADGDGNWHIQLSDGSRLLGTRGNWTFQVTAVDEAGNSANSDQFKVNYVASNQDDITAPDIPVITDYTDNVGASTGNQASGTVTDDTTPMLNGHAEAGSLVKIYEGNTLLGSVAAGSNGDWHFTPPARSEGSHTFTATATDAAGNTSEATVGFVVKIDVPDTTPPAAPAITDVYDDVGTTTGKVVSGGKTDDLQPKLNGTGEPGSHISITMTGPVSGKIHTIATVTVGADGTWHYQFVGGQALQAGNNVFHTTATDAAGNTAAGNDFSVKLVGSNQDGNDTTPPAAPHIVSGYDDVNISTAIGKFYSGDTIDDTTPKLSGTAEANSVVKIYDNNVAIGSTTANSSGSWSYATPARSEGKHTFTATATDAAGNASGKSGGFVVNVDVPNPVVKHIESFEGTEIPSHFYNLTTQTGVHITSSAGLYLLTTPGVLVDSVNGTHVLGGGNFAREQAISVSLPGASETVFVNLQTQSISGIRFYDASGLQIHATMKDTGHAGGDLQLHRYEFTADAGHSISSFTVSASYIDTIEWHNSTSYSTMINHQNPLSQMMVQADDEQASSGSTEIINHLSQDVLHLTLNDILSEAHDNLFIQDGHKQLAVTGDAGDVVELKVEDLAHNTWQDAGQVTAGGVQYEVYQHAGSDVELLVQQGLELHQVS